MFKIDLNDHLVFVLVCYYTFSMIRQNPYIFQLFLIELFQIEDFATTKLAIILLYHYLEYIFRVIINENLPKNIYILKYRFELTGP